MSNLRAEIWAAAGLALAVVALTATAQKSDKEQDSKRPRLTLRVQPTVSVAPSRVVLTAELAGGANDFEEYYCPGVQWEWGDDTSSESSSDCPPYEAGKTEIKRRFTTEHIFRRPGSFKVYFRLKHREKEVAAASATVQVQPGAGFF